MPIQQLTTYDIIVDTLPGAFLLLLLVPLLPEEAVEVISGTKIAASVIIVGAGYIVGRLIHTVGPGFDDVDIPKKSSTDDEIAWLVVSKLADRIFVPPENLKGNELEKERLDFIEENIDDIVKYGQSLLYSEETLYGRYEMLSTFFRNLHYSFSLIALLYLVWGLSSSISGTYSIQFTEYSTAVPTKFYFLGFILGATIAIICKVGWDTFIDRKSDAFVHDIHQKLDLQHSSGAKATNSK
ncbi:hypothetical protein [Natrinema pallidum]|uniref:Uncharacterized protein n=1 Tax=Natrinema pallidum TaxID=69527 RepID=A0A4P9TGI8_9EURY|nr:hypothetical protein [Natrinema pallidum]QCW03976.1 hypothetical protein FGF80_12330 [Natrinema pallidum]